MLRNNFVTPSQVQDYWLKKCAWATTACFKSANIFFFSYPQVFQEGQSFFSRMCLRRLSRLLWRYGLMATAAGVCGRLLPCQGRVDRGLPPLTMVVARLPYRHVVWWQQKGSDRELVSDVSHFVLISSLKIKIVILAVYMQVGAAHTPLAGASCTHSAASLSQSNCRY